MAEIIENYEVKKHTTFKIGGKVKKAVFPYSIEELVSLLKTEEYDLVLGNCSNVLFSSEDIDKSIIFTEKINTYNINEKKVNISCGAKGPVLSKECAKNSLSGFEFLVGFPGTFGAMININASAHNQSISDYIISVDVYDPINKKVLTFKKSDLEFKYRQTTISEKKYIVLSAEFELPQCEQTKIYDKMKENIEFRKTHQPSLKYPNAGSIFKNPCNNSAGKLLDLCDFKEKQEGGAQVFKNHANFIINANNAASLDVLNLMHKMYLKVKEKYGIDLQPEIKYIGNEGTKEDKIWKLITENMN